MESLKATKPFCLDHAKAGAPYACRSGCEATILKWDARGKLPLVGCFGAFDTACEWSAEGKHPSTDVLDLVMLPLGEIDGKPVFVGDEFEEYHTGKWIKGSAMPGNRGFEDCRWPAPEKQYPVTGMMDDELQNAVSIADQSVLGRARNIANAALRHAIDNGQVVIKDDHEAVVRAIYEGAKGYSAARYMAVAEAVRRACEQEASASMPLLPVFNVDLAAIIAKVKA